MASFSEAMKLFFYYASWQFYTLNAYFFFGLEKQYLFTSKVSATQKHCGKNKTYPCSHY